MSTAVVGHDSAACCRYGAAFVAAVRIYEVGAAQAIVCCAGRIEARAAAAEVGDERLALRKLGRRLREVHEELTQYDALVSRYRARAT